MDIIMEQNGNIKLQLLRKELSILESIVTEVSEEYHARIMHHRPIPITEPFALKFGHTIKNGVRS
jgi:hypothetical protein